MGDKLHVEVATPSNTTQCIFNNWLLIISPRFYPRRFVFFEGRGRVGERSENTEWYGPKGPLSALGTKSVFKLDPSFHVYMKQILKLNQILPFWSVLVCKEPLLCEQKGLILYLLTHRPRDAPVCHILKLPTSYTISICTPKIHNQVFSTYFSILFGRQ